MKTRIIAFAGIFIVLGIMVVLQLTPTGRVIEIDAPGEMKVDLHGDFLAVGSPEDFRGDGVVRVYHLDTDDLEPIGRLAGPFGGNSRFGYAIDFNNSGLAVGAPYDSEVGPQSGAVYDLTPRFHIDTHKMTFLDEKKYTASDTTTRWMGRSVALSPVGLYAGAYGDSLNGIQSGSVHHFIGDTLFRKITSDSARKYDQFGWSVATYQGSDVAYFRLVVGIRGLDVGDSLNTGGFAVYDASDNVKTQSMGESPGQRYGLNVVANRDWTVVSGIPDVSEVEKDSSWNNPGYVAIYNSDGYFENIYSEGKLEDKFGHDIALAGDLLAVTAPGKKEVWVYDLRTGARSSITEEAEGFGQSVDISEKYLVVGAAGKIFIY